MLAQAFGPPASWPNHDAIAYSDFFDAEITLAAYRSGAFPMAGNLDDPAFMYWWSPLRRGIIDVQSFRPSKSLRKSMRRYTTTIDADFDAVIRRCADPKRPHGWIDEKIISVYTELHGRGIVHSIETWDEKDRLVGGLYGVSIAGLFAGESMFHDPAFGRDASKVALARLVSILRMRNDEALLDIQWLTPHLASLGGSEIDRADYLQLLSTALERPETTWPSPHC